jgi:fluoride exporter
MNILWVALGGAVGASLRYSVMHLFVALRLTNFPYATLVVNVLGSFLMGILAFWLIDRFAYNEAIRLFLLVGILGAFTTFSAFSLDSLHLLLSHRYVAAFSYMFLTVSLCLLATVLGMLIVKLGE